MKKTYASAAFLCLSTLLFTHSIDARGSGRAGGGAINRSPSMSRSVPRNYDINRNIQRPNRSEINNQIQQTPRNVQDYTRASNVPTNTSLNDAVQARTQNNSVRSNVADNLRKNINEQYPGRNNWFNNDFMNRHDYTPDYRLGDGNAWKWATWAAVNRWNNWGWAEPYYYDYGDYDDDNIVYADQAQQISTAPDESYSASYDQPNQNNEWMSLGVFSITSPDNSGVVSNFYMQLALDKNGNIDGTLYNSTTDKAYPLEGLVDKDTQRAAWMMPNSKNAPIIETGIYNLTKDQAPARVIFADGSTKNVLLVRLNPPNN